MPLIMDNTLAESFVDTIVSGYVTPSTIAVLDVKVRLWFSVSGVAFTAGTVLYRKNAFYRNTSLYRG